MCLFIKNYKEGTNPCRASKDITVYKIFSKSPSGEYTSPVQCYPYEQGREYKIEGELKSIFDRVEEGFHSYRERGRMNIQRAFDDASDNGYNTYLVNGFFCTSILKCTIPKGAKYFVGNANDIVSDTIIIGDEIKIKIDKGSGCYPNGTFLHINLEVPEL